MKGREKERKVVIGFHSHTVDFYHLGLIGNLIWFITKSQ